MELKGLAEALPEKKTEENEDFHVETSDVTIEQSERLVQKALKRMPMKKRM